MNNFNPNSRAFLELCAYSEAQEKAREVVYTLPKLKQVEERVKKKESNPFSGNSLEWDHMVALEAIRLLASRLSCHRPLKTDEKELLDKLVVKI